MKKLRFLLLDASVVFQLFELGLWDQLIEHCDIILSRIVAEKEVKYFHGEEADEQIDLTPYVKARRITIVDVDASDVKRFRDQFDPVYLEKLDPGETESLAYLCMSDDPCLLSSSDGIVYRVLAHLNLAEQGISLEEILEKVGLQRALPDQFRRSFQAHWTKRGREEAVRGVGRR